MRDITVNGLIKHLQELVTTNPEIREYAVVLGNAGSGAFNMPWIGTSYQWKDNTLELEAE